MIDGYSLFGICLGVVGILILFMVRSKAKRLTPTLTEGGLVLLAGWAISRGVKVCVLTLSLSPGELGALQSERVYLFLGGIAVIWISVDVLSQKISRPY